jgi:hypothetical protein
MNRIVLIGNGFDLAHGLPTRYEDFINWYWDQRYIGFGEIHNNVSKDVLCEFKLNYPYIWSRFYYDNKPVIGRIQGKEIIRRILTNDYGIIIEHSFSEFFDRIIKSIETKGWVDIENEYYDLLIESTIGKTSYMDPKELNEQLCFLTNRLVDYLASISTNELKRLDSIYDSIYSPIKPEDVSNDGQQFVVDYVKQWMEVDESVLREKIRRYGFNELSYLQGVRAYKESFTTNGIPFIGYPNLFMLPDAIMLLNFNYTDTSSLYCNRNLCITTHIHGELQNPDGVIFGYGDELDDKYKELKDLNNNECLRNVKSIKYLESANYRNVLGFMESAPFQVFIMGHSCGNSDRTLLNTIFEHKNCLSIKPFYHQKADGTDNYLSIVQNISRNFTDMKLMRDRVVNKTYCEPLAQMNSQ